LEPIFENKIIITKEILSEFAQKSFKVLNKKYRAFVLCMHIISVVVAISALIINGSIWAFTFFLILAIFFLFMFYKGYIIKLKQSYRNLKGLLGDSPEKTIRFYEDNFEVITLISNLNIEYSKATKIMETKNLYLLLIEEQGIIIAKNGFTIGNSDKFKSFIIGKCKNI
jgi:hypothetical protein